MRRGRAVILTGLMAPALAGAIGSASQHGGGPLPVVVIPMGAVDGAGEAAAESGGWPTGQELDQGRALAGSTGESIPADADAGCVPGAPVRDYDVVAIAVDITLNRYGDHDPDGRMYALAGDVDAIRAAE